MVAKVEALRIRIFLDSLPTSCHDVAKMAGVDLPDYLGSMKEE